MKGRGTEEEIKHWRTAEDRRRGDTREEIRNRGEGGTGDQWLPPQPIRTVRVTATPCEGLGEAAERLRRASDGRPGEGL